MKVLKCDKCSKHYKYSGQDADGSVFMKVHEHLCEDTERTWSDSFHLDLCMKCGKELSAVLLAWWQDSLMIVNPVLKLLVEKLEEGRLKAGGEVT